MNLDNFTPQEQQLINQLRGLPQPQMDQPVFDAIKQQLFAELSAPPPAPTPSAKPQLGIPKPIIIGIVVVVIVIIVLIVVSIAGNKANATTLIPTITQVTATATSEVTATDVVLTTTDPAPTNEAVQVGITPTLPEATITPLPTETPIPATATMTPTASQEVGVTETVVPLMVIEGPVQAINVNVVTVFDMEIQIDSADPVLNELEIGDNIRVEGMMNFESNTIVIVAVNITIIDIDIIIVAPDGDSVSSPGNVPPGCKVTKKGNIKCSKKSKKSKKSKDS